ncbi:MAG TPA: HAD hydrolase-like protein, partial [Thiobacillus sp.]
MKLAGIKAVLFDLDGTLVDTAPDLGHALNLQRARHGLPPLADDVIRPQASHGARGLLGVGFDLHPDDARFESMREEFLQLYADNICRHSRPFPGILELLAGLDARGLKWGVVTNKPARFTEPLMSSQAQPADGVLPILLRDEPYALPLVVGDIQPVAGELPLGAVQDRQLVA